MRSAPPTTSAATRLLVPPSASLMPISCVRCVTTKDTTPKSPSGRDAQRQRAECREERGTQAPRAELGIEQVLIRTRARVEGDGTGGMDGPLHGGRGTIGIAAHLNHESHDLRRIRHR